MTKNKTPIDAVADDDESIDIKTRTLQFHSGNTYFQLPRGPVYDYLDELDSPVAKYDSLELVPENSESGHLAMKTRVGPKNNPELEGKTSLSIRKKSGRRKTNEAQLFPVPKIVTKLIDLKESEAEVQIETPATKQLVDQNKNRGVPVTVTILPRAVPDSIDLSDRPRSTNSPFRKNFEIDSDYSPLINIPVDFSNVANISVGDEIGLELVNVQHRTNPVALEFNPKGISETAAAAAGNPELEARLKDFLEENPELQPLAPEYAPEGEPEGEPEEADLARSVGIRFRPHDESGVSRSVRENIQNVDGKEYSYKRIAVPWKLLNLIGIDPESDGMEFFPVFENGEHSFVGLPAVEE